MLPEDEKRLQREADIAKAKLGPDYSRLETEIANAKSEQASKEEAGRDADAQHARGAAIRRRLEQAGSVPQVARPERELDKDQER